VGVFVRAGVGHVKLTGGEPLMRPKLWRLVERISALGVEVSMTTNGVLLEQQLDALAAAGLDRVTVSLDTLDPARFAALTRRPVLERVLRGIDAARERFGMVKINAVILPGTTREDVMGLVGLARRDPRVQVTFNEQQPFDGSGGWRRDQVRTTASIRAVIEDTFALVPLDNPPAATAMVYRFADGVGGRIGLCSPVSVPFCDTCDRARLLADGALASCLYEQEPRDLRGPLRAGASDDELLAIVADAIALKPRGIKYVPSGPTTQSMTHKGG
jgi:cyclic pyranopterin phosphate synthase